MTTFENIFVLQLGKSSMAVVSQAAQLFFVLVYMTAAQLPFCDCIHDSCFTTQTFWTHSIYLHAMRTLRFFDVPVEVEVWG